MSENGYSCVTALILFLLIFAVGMIGYGIGLDRADNPQDCLVTADNGA